MSLKPNRKSSESTTAAERRNFPRVASHCLVDWRPVGQDPTFQHLSDQQGVLQNISGGGVCICMADPPEYDASIALDIHLPDFPTSVIAVGRVAWIGPPTPEGNDVGIEFWWVGWKDAHAQEQIRDFVTSRLPGSRD
jgi:Tfp pilus assembly protein PilZ